MSDVPEPRMMGWCIPCDVEEPHSLCLRRELTLKRTKEVAFLPTLLSSTPPVYACRRDLILALLFMRYIYIYIYVHYIAIPYTAAILPLFCSDVC